MDEKTFTAGSLGTTVVTVPMDPETSDRGYKPRFEALTLTHDALKQDYAMALAARLAAERHAQTLERHILTLEQYCGYLKTALDASALQVKRLKGEV